MENNQPLDDPQAAYRSDAQKPQNGLYIVATPIGNVRDITLRALDVLAAADLVLCEDTRVSQKLLSRYRLKPKCMAYHEHNAEKIRPKILDHLASGAVVALITDAGTPLISDPGMPLVRAARQAGHNVTGIPGASAPIMALSVAGLPTDRFCFAGFLPPKTAAREKTLADLLAAPLGTLVLFESARRLPALLASLAALAPAAEICVARELTKKFEQVKSGLAGELLGYFEANAPRGEVTVLISPPRGAAVPDEQEIDAMLHDAMASLSRRDAVQNIADLTGMPRKKIYARALSLAEEGAMTDSRSINDDIDDHIDNHIDNHDGEQEIGTNEKQEKPITDRPSGAVEDG